MAKLMSVAFTEQAVVERRKTVTRRKGWWRDKNGRELLVVGDRLTLCRKVMGRKPGEPLVRLVDVEVVSLRRERLDEILWRLDYGEQEMVLEGFPGMSPNDFIATYFTPQGIALTDDITRIEYAYTEETP